MLLPPAFQRALWLGAATALVAIQIGATQPGQSVFWSALFNAGHVPLYGVVALILLRLLRLRQGCAHTSRTREYLLAFSLALAAGAVAESLQGIGAGDVDAVDIARDGLGAMAFLLVASGLSDGTRRGWKRPSAWIQVLAAGGLLLVGGLPLARTSLAYAQRNAAFPRICGFEDSWEQRFVSVNEAVIERVPPPAGWRCKPANQVAHIRFDAGTYPGLSIACPCPDWRGHRELVFEVYSPVPETVELVLRIEDAAHDGLYADRFNRIIYINPGANRIAIAFSEIRTAPRERELDMSRISGLALFADHPREAFWLFLDDFRLE